MAKTNKSFLKRLKVTRNGKVVARHPGQNHFNAKESRSKQLQQKGSNVLEMKAKVIKKYLPNM